MFKEKAFTLLTEKKPLTKIYWKKILRPEGKRGEKKKEGVYSLDPLEKSRLHERGLNAQRGGEGRDLKLQKMKNCIREKTVDSPEGQCSQREGRKI